MHCPRGTLTLSVVLVALSWSACRFGKVAQGRAVAYNARTGVITIVPERWDARSNKENYVLPAMTVETPRDAREMGPSPRTGKLLTVDLQRKQLVYFDADGERLRTVDWRLVDEQFNVFEGDPRIAGNAVPAVNRTSGTITLYISREHMLIEIAVPAEYLDRPTDTWKAGDEIRYYYKDPRRALRLMNVSRTDFSKGEH